MNNAPETIESISITGLSRFIRFTYIECDGIVSNFSSWDIREALINGRKVFCGDGRTYTKESVNKILNELANQNPPMREELMNELPKTLEK